MNETYTCFVDPTDTQRRPLKHEPNVTDARNSFIYYTCVPGLVLAAEFILVFIVAVNTWLDNAVKPRGVSRVQVHPTRAT